MSNTPVPFLWFDGDAEAAAELYTGLFPRSAVTDVSRGPDGAAFVVSFTLDGQAFVALNGGPGHPFTDATSFQVPCADQAEVDHFWDGLVAGGGQEGRCGWLTDRFGVSWQVVPVALPELLGDPDPGRSQRAVQAMLGMSRLVVADLRAAADG